MQKCLTLISKYAMIRERYEPVEKPRKGEGIWELQESGIIIRWVRLRIIRAAGWRRREIPGLLTEWTERGMYWDLRETSFVRGYSEPGSA